MVRQAHAVAEGIEITPDDLPSRIVLAAEAAAQPPADDAAIVLEDFLDASRANLSIGRLCSCEGKQGQGCASAGHDATATVPSPGAAGSRRGRAGRIRRGSERVM